MLFAEMTQHFLGNYLDTFGLYYFSFGATCMCTKRLSVLGYVRRKVTGKQREVDCTERGILSFSYHPTQSASHKHLLKCRPMTATFFVWLPSQSMFTC
mmetsp:Transcript_81810/g.144388  ORF Transcript_81810/g.144388 Transcript_81810/m.144388 type:complete len:98 (-) Transcript_81810:891-1184(-)